MFQLIEFYNESGWMLQKQYHESKILKRVPKAQKGVIFNKGKTFKSSQY